MQERRRDFIESVEHIDPNDIIVIDESSSHLGMATDYARAEGGNRANSAKPLNIGEKFSIVGAISVIGIVAVMYIELAINTDIFAGYVKRWLVPKLCPGKFVVLDNVKFHHAKTVIDLIESAGAKVVFLPPYSPDLSPIEKMWSKVKEILKRLMPRTKAEFHEALALALSSVNPEDCEEWYAACGYPI